MSWRILESCPPIDARLGILSFFEYANKYNQLKPLKRIFSVLRDAGVRSFVEQKVEPASQNEKELEKAILTECYGKAIESTYERILFLLPRYYDICLKNISDEDMLGYVILKFDYFNGNNNPDITIVESVLKKKKSNSDYIHIL